MEHDSLGNEDSLDELRVFFQIIADDMEMLAVLHDKEPAGALIEKLREEDFPGGLGLKLVEGKGLQAIGLMRQALQNFPEKIDAAIVDELAVDFASIYLNYAIHASPEESVWIDEENLACQDSMFRVRNWYEQYDLKAENWRVRPDDHLVLQLQFLSRLFQEEPSEFHMRTIARFWMSICCAGLCLLQNVWQGVAIQHTLPVLPY